MSSCELGKTSEMRREFEKRYQEELSCLRLGLSPEPPKSAPNYQNWRDSVALIGELMEKDPRIWDIIYRLAVPINDRLDDIKERISREREQYSRGYRKKTVQVLEDEMDDLWMDAAYAQMDEDTYVLLVNGGFTAGGTWVPPQPGTEAMERLTELKSQNEQNARTRDNEVERLTAEVDRYNGPLTSEEQYRLDHELG